MNNHNLVDLNFKVPRRFRAAFKLAALRRGMTGRELLFAALAAFGVRGEG